jgi:Xaa-Pro aminopeptidase
MPEQHIKLEAGMALTLEPGLQIKDNNSLVHEENFIVTEEGGKLLNERAPQKMVRIEM